MFGSTKNGGKYFEAFREMCGYRADAAAARESVMMKNA
jgi:hypothetical protein